MSFGRVYKEDSLRKMFIAFKVEQENIILNNDKIDIFN